MSLEKIRGHPPDFDYRFFTPEEGGRHSGPPWQHYRGDWAYAETPKELYIIHPEMGVPFLGKGERPCGY